MVRAHAALDLLDLSAVDPSAPMRPQPAGCQPYAHAMPLACVWRSHIDVRDTALAARWGERRQEIMALGRTAPNAPVRSGAMKLTTNTAAGKPLAGATGTRPGPKAAPAKANPAPDKPPTASTAATTSHLRTTTRSVVPPAPPEPRLWSPGQTSSTPRASALRALRNPPVHAKATASLVLARSAFADVLANRSTVAARYGQRAVTGRLSNLRYRALAR